MPAAIIPAVIAAAGSAASAWVVGAAVTWTSLALAAGGSLLMSAASSLLTKKPKSRSISADSSITLTQRSSNAPSEIVYGQVRKGGVLVYMGATQNNEYLHMVIVLAGHEVYSIDEVIFDEDSIHPTDIAANGDVTSGKYAGVARIVKHLGEESQAADSYLVSEISEWTNEHKLSGCAYLYVRLKYSADKFPNGEPNITAIVRGKKLYDPRSETTAFSYNTALMVRDYLSSNEYGFEAADFIDDESVSAAAGVCGEIVDTTPEAFTAASVANATNSITLQGDTLKLFTGDRVQVSSTGTLPSGLSAATNYYVIGYQYIGTPRIRLAATSGQSFSGAEINLTTDGTGTLTVTKNGEPRYHSSTILSRDANLGDNLLSLLTGLGGRAVYAGGLWRIAGASYEAPTLTLDEGDFIDAININTKISRADRFNAVRGLYYSHINRWNSADYPQVVDDAAVERDGDLIPRDYDLPCTFRPHTAQRLAKIELKRAAQELTIDCVCSLKAMALQCGDTVSITNSRMAWSAKVFEVMDFNFTFSQERMGVALTLRETAASVYDWTMDEESAVDTAPNTNIPNVFDVAAPSGLSFDSQQIITDGGDAFYNIRLLWAEHPDAFVKNGGQFEVQFKLESELTYRPSKFVSGDLTQTDVTQAEIGVEYEIRIRAINNIGVKSSWSGLSGVFSGSSGGVSSSTDYGLITDAVTTSVDYGLITDAVTATDDFGGVL